MDNRALARAIKIGNLSLVARILQEGFIRPTKYICLDYNGVPYLLADTKTDPATGLLEPKPDATPFILPPRLPGDKRKIRAICVCPVDPEPYDENEEEEE
jgi:hypothetical protein